MKKLKVAATTLVLLTTVPLHAADIARDVNEGNRSDDSFFELGFSILHEDVPLVGIGNRSSENEDNNQVSISVDLQGRFEYKGFFAEIIDNSFSKLTLGFNAYNTESSSIDIIANQMFEDIPRNGIEGFESISERDGDANIGVRANYYAGNNMLQFEVVGDVSDSHNGISASAQYARYTQYRNWNIHALAGVRYFSDKVLDYYFGVPADESINTLATYNAGQGFMPSIQVGGALPLNENWVVRTSAAYSLLPDSVSDSPLAFGDNYYAVQAGIYRVIYP